MAATSQSSTLFYDYDGFVEKFKPKKTTDDCYTPPVVYDVILDWVKQRYNLENDTPIVRPFYPGGDYENYDYPDGCVIVDNPPFSILSKIIYNLLDKGVKFFLFSPALTLLGIARKRSKELTYLPLGVTVTYDNGANVATSFITNLITNDEPELQLETVPDLYQAIVDVQKSEKSLPKYEYPKNLITASQLNQYSKYGVHFKLNKESCCSVDRLDAQRPFKKTVYGCGYLLSANAATERIKADKTAAENATASAKPIKIWELSEREKEIINGMI